MIAKYFRHTAVISSFVIVFILTIYDYYFDGTGFQWFITFIIYVLGYSLRIIERMIDNE